MQQVDIVEAKAQIEALLQSALSGEEIIITQNQQPILKLTGNRRKAPGFRRGDISQGCYSGERKQPIRHATYQKIGSKASLF